TGRMQLLYGEWLRREGRRIDARGQLEAAYELLSDSGAMAFAERARREFDATGAKLRRPASNHGSMTDPSLTAQELQIARLAADGLTNPEIGGRLFISSHTVEWHLRKVFAKLDVGSRHHIRSRLAERSG
ncbi:MAG TPA: LuxR C-terminal-related transcriptional regulator, partial [Microlunatus sp.]